MDKTLQRLLDAETRAEAIHHKAQEERQQVIDEAMREAQAQGERFEASIPALHSGLLEKADERAEQTIAELHRRFDERHIQVREYAEGREQEALDAAFALLIDPAADD